MGRWGLVVALVLVAGACGPGEVSPLAPTVAPAPDEEPAPSTPRPGQPGSLDESDGYDGVERPPPVLVRGGDVELALDAWTACWANGCFDGFPPQVLPDIGSPVGVVVEFPVPGWEFSATVQPVGEECGRRQTEPLERIGDTTYRLTPIGLAGDHEVTLFGRGEGGDLFVSFRWRTTADGAMPVPGAYASILADPDGEVDSYEAEVSVWNLRRTPESASAEVRVTAADGKTHTIALTRQDYDCTEGTLFFTGEVSEGLAAARLGSPPFSYQVTLEMEGDTYVGQATWPDDVDPECSPCVPLLFDPPLPALEAGSPTGPSSPP